MDEAARANTTASTVRTRRVFYIPGYDPVPPRKYRERYRAQSARQAALSGYEIALSPKTTDARFGWHVTATIDGIQTETDVEVLYWADIVRSSMEQGIVGTYGQLVHTAWAYIGSGALFRLMRLRKGPLIAALYPVAVLLGQLLIGVLLILLASWGAERLLGAAIGRWPAIGLGMAFGSGMAWMWLRWCQRRDHVLAWYLMHDYAFSAGRQGAYPPEQETRMAAFRDRIADTLSEPVDEVLVIGHSSGAYLAISILADLLRADQGPSERPVLSLLTLGHVVPMVSFLPKADRLRRDLAEISQQDRIPWIDVTAPGDGCSFALCDPVAVSGVAPETKRWPLVLSAAFRQTLRPETWNGLRWHLFECHFQYLNAFDALGDAPDSFDYFRITAGPQTLAGRLGQRTPSPSRIEAAVNGYTTMVP